MTAKAMVRIFLNSNIAIASCNGWDSGDAERENRRDQVS